MAETVLLKGATVNCNTIPTTVSNNRVIYIHNVAGTPVLVTQSTGQGNTPANSVIGTITLSSGNGAACQVTLIKDMSDQLYSNATSGCTAAPIGYTT
jgi:hypothetical protein